MEGGFLLPMGQKFNGQTGKKCPEGQSRAFFILYILFNI